MLTGRIPFNADTPVEIAQSQLDTSSELFLNIRNNIPKPFNNIILRCVQPILKDRFQTPEEMIEEIKNSMPNLSYYVMSNSIKHTVNSSTGPEEIFINKSNIDEEVTRLEEKAPDQNNINSLLKEADKFRLKGEYEKALKYYDRVLSADINDVAAWYGEGETFYSLKEYKKAIECYDEVLEIDPENADALNGKGNALYYLDKEDEAIRYYNKVLKIDPENIDAF